MIHHSIDSVGAKFYTFSTDENMPYFIYYVDMVNRDFRSSSIVNTGIN